MLRIGGKADRNFDKQHLKFIIVQNYKTMFLYTLMGEDSLN